MLVGVVQSSITPTASNSSFWINATLMVRQATTTHTLGNISDSQVGATTPIFTDASRSHSYG